jgi:hypothetical protein
MNRRMFFGTLGAALVGVKLMPKLPPVGAIPGVYAEGAIIRYTAGGVLFGRYTSLTDHEYIIPLRDLPQWRDVPTEVHLQVQPDALARAAERLKARA